MGVAVVLLVLVVAFGGFALWALHERGVAARERRAAIDQAAIARSQALAANSLSELEIDPERSLLLAVAAADARRTPQAEDALRQAVPPRAYARSCAACAEHLARREGRRQQCRVQP